MKGFSSCSRQQNHLEGLEKQSLLGPTPRMSDSEGLALGGGPNICLYKESLCDADGTLAASGRGKIKNSNLVFLNIRESK